jgi:hypothetical protein
MSTTSSQDSSGNDSSRNSTELIDRYLQAVRFWLPGTHRQDDLIAELGEDLRSQFEDKETELGRPLDKAEMSAILKRCGQPDDGRRPDRPATASDWARFVPSTNSS